jgi:phage tail-like protein
MPYPIPVFHFSVDWGGTRMAFSEVTGLNIEAQVIEYRDGLSPEFSTIKMPGLKKFGNITLKRGVFAGDNDYYNWLNTIKLNKPERRDITISLLNEEHNPVMVWKVKNAWPTKMTSPDMKASGNEAAIESLEVAHEGVTVESNG